MVAIYKTSVQRCVSSRLVSSKLMPVNDDFICVYVVVYTYLITRRTRTVMRGIITPIHRYCIGVTKSHIRASCGEREEGKEGTQKRGIRFRARIKLSRVYILRTLFNFTTSRFNSDTTDFPPLPDHISLSPLALPLYVHFTIFLPLLFLSFSLVNFHSLSLSLSLPSSFPVSGAAHHFVNQDKLEISCRGTGFDSAEYIGRQRYIRSY